MLAIVVGLALFQGLVGVPSMLALLIGLVSQIQMPPPVRNIITAILAIIFLYILLHNFLGLI